jgi:hypothetical protein
MSLLIYSKVAQKTRAIPQMRILQVLDEAVARRSTQNYPETDEDSKHKNRQQTNKKIRL